MSNSDGGSHHDAWDEKVSDVFRNLAYEFADFQVTHTNPHGALVGLFFRLRLIVKRGSPLRIERMRQLVLTCQDMLSADGGSSLHAMLDNMVCAMEKAQIAFEEVKAKLKNLPVQLIIEEVIEYYLLHGHDLDNGKWNVDDVKALVKELLAQFEILKSAEIIDPKDEIFYNFEKFLKTSVKRLLKEDLLLNYLFDVQSKLTSEDMKRVIRTIMGKKRDVASESKKRGEVVYVNYDTMNILKSYFGHNQPELVDKFNSFCLISYPVNTIFACDFLLALRTLFQDQKYLKIYLKGEEKSGVNIFKSFNASPEIEKWICKFFYERLNIDPNIEGNDQPNLIKLNYHLFKCFLYYLSDNNVIHAAISVKVSSDAYSEIIKTSKGLNEKDDSNSLREDEILDNFKCNKLSENDYSLQYKLQLFMQDMRVSVDNAREVSKKNACFAVIDSIATELKKLDGFSNAFIDNRTDMAIEADDLKSLNMLGYYREGNWLKADPLDECEKFELFADMLLRRQRQSLLTRKHLKILSKGIDQNKGLDAEGLKKMIEKCISKESQLACNETTSKRNAYEKIKSEVIRAFGILHRANPNRQKPIIVHKKGLTPVVEAQSQSLIKFKRLNAPILGQSPSKNFYRPLRNLTYIDEKDIMKSSPSQIRKPTVLGQGIIGQNFGPKSRISMRAAEY